MDLSKLRGALLCALLPIAGVLATLPFVEMGINDDFSYTQIALHLANTGKMAYNGWNTPMVGFQAYWAALFIKLFGFSFVLVRLSTLPFVSGCSVLLYLLALYAGLPRSRAIFLAFVVAFSPLALPLEASFMTDVPALFFLLLCLMSVLQATDPQASRSKIAFWTAVLTAAGLTGGTIRQYVFLMPAVFLPYIAWRSRNLWCSLWCGVYSLTSVMGALALTHWFSLQPYAQVLPLLPLSSHATFLRIGGNLLGLLTEYGVLVVPVTVLYLFAGIRLPKAGWLMLSVWSVLFAVALNLAALHHHNLVFRGGLTGKIITETGILGSGTEVIGDKPRTLPMPLQMALIGTGAGLFALAAAQLIRCLCGSYALSGPVLSKWLRSGSGRVRFEHVCILFGCLYCPLVGSRAIVALALDRYLLPLLATGGLLLLLWLPARLPISLTAGWAFAALFALYGVATTHDYFACSRARLKAAEMLSTAHIPRQCISAGFEYDGWTEIALRGHLNMQGIVVPPNSWISPEGRTFPLAPPYWFWDETPTIQPSYLVVTSPQPGLLTLKEFAVRYQAWLPPFERPALVQAANAAAAECGRSTGATPPMHLPPMFLRRSGVSPPPFAAASWRWSTGGLALDAISATAGLEVSISAQSGHLPNLVHKVRVGSLHNPVQTVSAGRLPFIARSTAACV
jgi:hypothetical protein